MIRARSSTVGSVRAAVRAIVAGGVMTAAASSLDACAETNEAPSAGGPSPTEDARANPPPGSDASPFPDDASVALDGAARSRCSEGGFCYTPLPIQAPLLGVSAADVDDAWAVAEDAVLRWDGTSWELVYATSRPGLYGVWAGKSGDAWAVGREQIVRYGSHDGSAPSFREIPLPFQLDAASFWVTPASDAFWVVRSDGVRRLYEDPEGTMVVEELRPEVGAEGTVAYRWSSVWGFGPEDVYVGGVACGNAQCRSGNRSAIAHYDGSAWSITTLETTSAVTAMYGTAALDQPRQIWTGGYVLPIDPFFTYPEPVRLLPLTAEGIGAPLFTQSLVSSLPPYLQACKTIAGFAASPTAAWFTNGCLVYRWNGANIEAVATALDGRPMGRVNGVWGKNVDEAWIVGEIAPGRDAKQRTGFAARRKGRELDGGQP